MGREWCFPLRRAPFRRRSGALVLLLLALAGCRLSPVPAPLGASRVHHTATLLPDGRILVAGGILQGSGILNTAELYDPKADRWQSAPSMSDPRQGHTATPLANGQVLIAGGEKDIDATDTAERYDPATGKWAAAGKMHARRVDHTATLLPDGRVLVAGGKGRNGVPQNATASAEIYDPATNRWTAVAPMTTQRHSHTATLLRDGHVLIVGGDASEIYDPQADRWTPVRGPSIGLSGHTATLLDDGRVLVVDGDTLYLVYDPVDDRWSRPAPVNASLSTGHTATRLPDGQVLVTVYSVALQYDPRDDRWRAVRTLAAKRTEHTATLLADGRVVLIGGSSSRPVEVVSP